MDNVKSTYKNLVKLIRDGEDGIELRDEIVSIVQKCPAVLDCGRLKNGGVLLYHACSTNKLFAMFGLLQVGARVDVNCGHGDTPLMVAVSHVADDCATFLINTGADLHKKNKIGRTALHHAANAGRRRMFKFLVERGANPNLPDKFGTTPIDLFNERLCLYDEGDRSDFSYYLQSLKIERSRIDRSTVLDPVAPMETIPEI